MMASAASAASLPESRPFYTGRRTCGSHSRRKSLYFNKCNGHLEKCDRIQIEFRPSFNAHQRIAIQFRCFLRFPSFLHVNAFDWFIIILLFGTLLKALMIVYSDLIDYLFIGDDLDFINVFLSMPWSTLPINIQVDLVCLAGASVLVTI